MSKRFGLAAVVVLASAFACSVSSQIGRPCTLVKGTADGGVAPIATSDINPDAGEDIITFGATECEDLVCILDAAHVYPAYQAAQANGGVPITGYCSRSCVKGSSDCSRQYQDQQKTPDLAMSCRALVLDQNSINQICKDPQACQQLLGGNQSPYFCARGQDVVVADGG